jgi:hypothetical protein
MMIKFLLLQVAEWLEILALFWEMKEMKERL